MRVLHVTLSLAIGTAAAVSMIVSLMDEQFGMVFCLGMLTTASVYCAVRGPMHPLPRSRSTG